MSLEALLVEALHNLPPTKQQELLDFARKLAEEEVKVQRKSSYGTLAGLGADISLEEFKEARREAWGGQRRGDGQ